MASPISLSAYPVAQELSAALEAGGYTINLSADSAALYLESAIDTFERRTNWSPFLADENDTTRRFSLDVRGGTKYLDFDGGLVSLTSIAIDGRTLTEWEDFTLTPENATQRKRPYTGMDFNCYRSSGRGGVVILGRWGYALPDNCPPAARLVVLSLACLLIAAPETARRITSGLSGSGEDSGECEDTLSALPLASLKEGEVSMEIATSSAERQSALTRWQNDFESGVKMFRRLTIY